jgi:drug/metabolite transporter (DMT)-like permease
MRYWKSLINLSAQEWQVNGRLATLSFWGSIIGSIFFIAIRLDKDIFRFLLDEDGPVETLQALFFGSTAIFAVGTAMWAMRTRRHDQLVLFLLLAAVMIFVTGEEISWGQRIFGWETPAELAEINKQDETTLHNIGEVLSIINIGMMIVGAIGSVAYLLNKRLRLQRYWQELDFFLVPPFFLAAPFFLVFLYKFVRLVFLPESTFTLTKYSEWIELCFAYSLLIFTYINYQRLKRVSSVKQHQLSLPTTETF